MSLAPVIIMLPLTSAVSLAIARHVLSVIPVIPHEVDPLAAGIILMAVLAPVLRVTRRNVQVDRLAHYGHRHTLDHDWPFVDQWRPGEVADLDTAIKAGLADIHRYAGKRGRSIQAANAMNHVAGYTLTIDLTARNQLEFTGEA